MADHVIVVADVEEFVDETVRTRPVDIETDVPATNYIPVEEILIHGKRETDGGSRVEVRADGTFFVGEGDAVDSVSWGAAHNGSVVGNGQDAQLTFHMNRDASTLMLLTAGRFILTPEDDHEAWTYLTGGISGQDSHGRWGGGSGLGQGNPVSIPVYATNHGTDNFGAWSPTGGTFRVKAVGYEGTGTYTGYTQTSGGSGFLNGTQCQVDFGSDHTSPRSILTATDQIGAIILQLLTDGGLYVSDEMWTFFPTRSGKQVGFAYPSNSARAARAPQGVVFYGENQTAEETADGVATAQVGYGLHFVRPHTFDINGQPVYETGVVKSTARLRVPRGSVTAPGLAFNGVGATSGFFYSNSLIGFAIGSTQGGTLSALGAGSSVDNAGGGGGVTSNRNPLTAGFTPTNATSGNRTHALPSASAYPGHEITVCKTDATANTVAITGGVSGTITLTAQHQSVTFKSDNVNWRPIARYP